MHMAHGLLFRDMVTRYDIYEPIRCIYVYKYLNMTIAYLEFDQFLGIIFSSTKTGQVSVYIIINII